MWLSTVADRTLQGIAALSWLLVQVASLRERGLVSATPGSTRQDDCQWHVACKAVLLISSYINLIRCARVRVHTLA